MIITRQINIFPVIHDLKNHLGIIETYTRILSNSSSILEELTELIEQINVAVVQSRILVNGLTYSAKINEKGLTYNPNLVDFTELLNTTVELLARVAQVKGIKLKNLIYENIIVTADEDKLTEIMVNLFYYSIQSSEKGSDITIYTTLDTSKRRVSVQLKYTGRPGPLTDGVITPEIFNNEYNEARHFGLYIACALLHIHGENLLIQSNGTSCWILSFTLPIREQI